MRNKGPKESYVIEDKEQLTGIQKVAVLMIAIGIEPASRIFKEMSDKEIEKVTIEIARINNIAPQVVDEVLQEFYDLMLAKQYVMEGGLDYAREILKNSKGDRGARDLLRRVEAATQSSAFSLFQTADTNQMVQFLENEHPQVSALILGHINVERAAEVLSNMDEELRSEIAYRLATMTQTSPEVLKEVEHVIRDQMGGIDGSETTLASNGATIVANILNAATISTEKLVLGEIEARDADLAEEIKNLMFLFEDIITLQDKVLQRVIVELENKDLVLALKGAEPKLLKKFTKNMSSRAKNILLEDMEALGPVRVKEVEDAQQRIIHQIKRLEESGEISIRKTSNEEMIE